MKDKDNTTGSGEIKKNGKRSPKILVTVSELHVF